MDFTRIRAILWRFRFVLAAVALLAMAASALSTLKELRPETVGVVVADRDLPAGAKLNTGDVRVADVPRALAPRGVLTSPGDVDGRTLTTPVPKGIPVAPQMLLSKKFLASVEPGQVVVPVAVQADGTESLLTPGQRVALYAPKDEHAQSPEAVKVVSRATIVGVGTASKSKSFSRDLSNTLPLFLAIPADTATLVIGYGSAMPMRVLIVH